MADTAIHSPSCGAELPDGGPGATGDWPVTLCTGCGTGVVACRGPALCSACGIEYHCEAAVLAGGQPVAKCPTCGSTAADSPAVGLRRESMGMELSWGFYFWAADMFLFTLLCALVWRKYGEPSW